VAAVIAVAACESLREDAAVEIFSKLLFNVCGKRLRVALSGVLEKRLQVLENEVVEKSLFRAARLVGACKHTGLPKENAVPRRGGMFRGKSRIPRVF
jgi:hypothetical protein